MKKHKLLTKKKPEKRLLLSLKKRAGRAMSGRITVRYKGGGVKKRYRIVDFNQKKIDIPAKVIAIEYDPNRSAFISLLQYKDGEKRYQICPDGLKVGDEIICSEKAEIKTGNRMKLKNIPVGTMVYNVELEPGRGGRIAKGAGTSVRVLARSFEEDESYINLLMPSGEIRKVLSECFVSVGSVSFPEHRFVKLEKAGQSRLLRRRPVVRGSAMNPCDHPHGGGEGRCPIGLKHPKTPWGKIALGVKTRRNKRTNKFIIQRRKKKKKTR
jgi:large subunit ribosomal protein L2